MLLPKPEPIRRSSIVGQELRRRRSWSRRFGASSVQKQLKVLTSGFRAISNTRKRPTCGREISIRSMDQRAQKEFLGREARLHLAYALYVRAHLHCSSVG